MNMIELFANMALVVNDLFAMLTVLGSSILLLGSFVPMGKFGQIADWSIGGLIFGAAGQVCIFLAGMQNAKIGILVPQSFWAINLLLLASIAMLMLRWRLRSNQ